MASKSFDELKALVLDVSEPYFERRDALVDLARDFHDKALGIIADALDDKEKAVRRKAAELLGQFKEPAAAKALIKALEDNDDDVKRKSLKSLAEVGDSSLVEKIEKYASHRSYFVKREAEKTLKAIKDRKGSIGETPSEEYPSSASVEVEEETSLPEKDEVEKQSEPDDIPVPETPRPVPPVKTPDKKEKVFEPHGRPEDPEKRRIVPERKSLYSSSGSGKSAASLYRSMKETVGRGTETAPDIVDLGKFEKITDHKPDKLKPGQINCPKCRKAVSSSDRICTFCATELKPPRRAAKQRIRQKDKAVTRSVPPVTKKTTPAISEFQAIILKTDSYVNIEDAISRMGSMGKRGLVRQLRRGSGILVRDASPQESSALLKIFRADRVPVFTMPTADLVHLPKSRLVRNASLYKNRIKISIRGSKEEVSKSWDDIFLIVCGVIIPSTGEKGRHFTAGVPRVVIDIFFLDPFERYRMTRDVQDFGEDSGHGDVFQQLGKEFYNFAADEALNPGMEILSQSGFAGNWSSVTFPGQPEFDAYTMWLLQVRKFEKETPPADGRYTVPVLGKPERQTAVESPEFDLRKIVPAPPQRRGRDLGSNRFRSPEHSSTGNVDTISELIGEDDKGKTIGCIIFIIFLIFIFAASA